MLKIPCTLNCEYCDNTVDAWLELNRFGNNCGNRTTQKSPDPIYFGDVFGDMFGSFFLGSSSSRKSEADFVVKGDAKAISSWKIIDNSFKFACSDICYKKHESKVKEHNDTYKERVDYIRNLSEMKEPKNISGVDLPDWFWVGVKEKVGDKVLCLHDMPVDIPGNYRLICEKITTGFFNVSKLFFWHEPTDSVRRVKLRWLMSDPVKDTEWLEFDGPAKKYEELKNEK